MYFSQKVLLLLLFHYIETSTDVVQNIRIMFANATCGKKDQIHPSLVMEGVEPIPLTIGQ